ncbi:hypothetical protein SNOG_04862 [Parastagonospora nodorum SN15]|uniref:Uncharacterized protein n=1 Tax=Phaeosphaeria nodorum (strain SN15 / ATCC MYA-4574 / FGSC 10173) TaxID=321614 RepID=Q0UTQ2_PHANO|nr:hypothetical protein SNOG_04862 [Parastagonospora nodorum SN15]EAT87253.1 hypothetical protein SNOG_04862 [Parastagonospora nodorum SN15]
MSLPHTMIARMDIIRNARNNANNTNDNNSRNNINRDPREQ